MEPEVQISIDVTTIEEALDIAEVAVGAGVDWLEAGTPLILGEGLHAVSALKERFPHTPVVADLKIMDGGYLETEMAAKAGADMVVVMDRAPMEFVAATIAAVSVPVQVVGGLSIKQMVECVRLGAPYVVVGAPLVVADERFAAADELSQLGLVLREVVERVRGAA